MKHIFEEPHEKSHEKIFKSNSPLVPTLPQIRDFQGCFLMVLEGFSHSARLNLWPMHSAPNTLPYSLFLSHPRALGWCFRIKDLVKNTSLERGLICSTLGIHFVGPSDGGKAIAPILFTLRLIPSD